MDIVDLENKREELRNKLNTSSSQREKVLLIADYYSLLLNNDNKNIIDSYIVEFIEIFINCLNNYIIIGIKPAITNNIIELSERLIKLSFLSAFKKDIDASVKGIKLNYNKLLKILGGDSNLTVESENHYIPVLEEVIGNSSLKLGLLETISVSLKKTKDIGKFVIVPSGKELEKRLITQVETSWKVALNNSSKYLRKKIDNLDVIVSFDKRFGYYTGNSLGTALAILFLEEILKFYNSPVIINKRNVTAITGGIDEDGNILSVTNDIIQQKTGTVFYSDVNLFVIPKQDEKAAISKLSNLRNKYPKRKLNIESIENFDDLLNRRNIVEIIKQKAVVRSAKFIAKSWAAFLLLAVVVLLVYFGRFYDFDTNPALLVNEGYWVSVRNINGKELWTKRMRYNADDQYQHQKIIVTEKIVDVDDDGINEVILTNEDQKQFRNFAVDRVACFSSAGALKWEYYFRDSITSVEQVHSLDYSGYYIIDTISINNTKLIALFANHTLYPSAVFFLELKTGKRIGSTMWHVGHLHAGLISDLNQDGNKELIMTGLNNSLGRVVCFSIDIENIDGQLPVLGDRMFIDRKIVEVNDYILLPKSDYTNYLGLKFNHDLWGNITLISGTSDLRFYLFEGEYPNYKGIMVEINKDMEVKKLDISEGFEVTRDSLVARGELNPPYSHTKEYKNYLFDQLRYWDGEKFVTGNEYHKIKAARDERLELPPINNVP